MSFAGQWKSKYEYFSDSQSQGLISEHIVEFKQSGVKLLGRSKPHKSGSELSLRLVLDGNVVTGTWQEKTSQTGHYGGNVFHGAIQLIASDNGKEMHGLWLGFNSDKTKIKYGNWVLVKK